MIYICSVYVENKCLTAIKCVFIMPAACVNVGQLGKKNETMYVLFLGLPGCHSVCLAVCAVLA